MEMQAAVFRQVQQPLTIESVDLDKPWGREVLVRTVATGVCHSDLHVVDGVGRFPLDKPIVLGHEGAGIVEAVGPDVKLMVDANCAYRYYQAIQLAKRIEEYDVYWFEEPVAPDDYEGHAKLAEQTSIPIATGENEYTRYGFRDLIAHNAAVILNADAQILGGVTEFMKVAALAQAHDLDIAPHGDQNVHVHLVSAISNGLIVEYYRDSVDPMWRKMYQQTLLLNNDGTLSPPDRPGLGVEPNDAALAPYRVE